MPRRERTIIRGKSKYCPRCCHQKPSEQFYIARRRKDGLAGHCIDCSNEAAREWREANPERHAENVTQWRDENPDRDAANHREWVESHRETVRKINSASYRRRREKRLAEMRAYDARRRAAAQQI